MSILKFAWQQNAVILQAKTQIRHERALRARDFFLHRFRKCKRRTDFCGGIQNQATIASDCCANLLCKFATARYARTRFLGATVSAKERGMLKSIPLSLAEAVGFEPTVPWGTTDFESVPLWPLRYASVLRTWILYHSLKEIASAFWKKMGKYFYTCHKRRRTLSVPLLFMHLFNYLFLSISNRPSKSSSSSLGAGFATHPLAVHPLIIRV